MVDPLAKAVNAVKMVDLERKAVKTVKLYVFSTIFNHNQLA